MSQRRASGTFLRLRRALRRSRMETREDLREAVLEAQAEAALSGHDLGPFERWNF